MSRGLIGQPLWGWLLALFVGISISWLSLSVGGIVWFGFGVALLILVFPFMGIGLTLVAAPFGALESFLLGGSSLDTAQFLLIMTAGAWLAQGLVRRRLLLRPSGLSLMLLTYIALVLLSLGNALSIASGLKELLKWIEMLLLLLVVTDMLWQWEEQGKRPFGKEPLIILITFLLVAGLGQSLIGIWQFVRGSGPDHFAIFGRFYRAYGTFHQPNPFGGFSAINGLLALGILLSALPVYWRNRVHLGCWREWVWITLVAIAAIGGTGAVLASWSRGAWLGFASGVTMIILFYPKRPWRGMILLLSGTAVVVLLLYFNLIPASIMNRLGGFATDFSLQPVSEIKLTAANYAVVERLAFWEAAFGMHQAEPWLGIGFGNYDAAYSAFAPEGWPRSMGHAHNYYLNILAETGWIGLGAYLLLWGWIWGQTIRQLWVQDGIKRGIVLGLIGVWSTIAVHHLVDKLYVNNIYIYLGVMLAILQFLSEKRETKNI